MLCSSSKSVAILALAWFAILPAESRMVSAKTFEFEDSPVALHELAVLADCTEPVAPMEIAPRFSAPKFGVLVDNVPTMLAFVLFVAFGAVTMFMDSFEFTDSEQREGFKAHDRPPCSEQLSWATLALLVLLVAATWQATSPDGSATTTTSCQPSLFHSAKLNVFGGLALGELDHFSYPNDTARAGDSIVLIVVLLVFGVLALIPMYADAEEIASEEAEIPVSQSNSSTLGSSFQCLLVVMCLLPVATLAALPSVDSITLSEWQSASLQKLGGSVPEKIMIIVYFVVFIVIGLLAMFDDFLDFAAEEDACAQREVCKTSAQKEGKQLSWSHGLMQQWRLISCAVLLLAMCGAAVSELWQNGT